MLEVLYLMFNEGYGAHEGASLIRPDLVGESIRLTSMLLRTPAMGLPKVHALLALELFQGARLSAKVGPLGDLVVLEHQDRAQWDRTMITAGFEHLRQAGRGPELTEYHLQAGIASCHAQAPDYERTDWTQILSMYDMLIDINPSPVVALNRAVAVMMTRGLDDGLRALDCLEDSPRLRDYYLLPATRAEMLRRAGHGDDAAQLFRRALTLACSEPEQRLLRERLEAVTNGNP